MDRIERFAIPWDVYIFLKSVKFHWEACSLYRFDPVQACLS